jgi:hypothetical protein
MRASLKELSMLKRCLPFLLGLGLVAWPSVSPAAPETATPPTVIVRVRSVESLLADIKYMLTLAGKEKEAKQLDAQISKALPMGFAGVDIERPLGLYGMIDPDGNLQDSTAMLLVPVRDEKALLGLIETLAHEKPKQEEDGVYSFGKEAFRVPGYLRFAKNYAYVTAQNKDGLAPAKLLDPAEVLTAKPAHSVSIALRLDGIPNAIKQLAISNAEVRLSNVEDEKPAGETPAQHALKVQAAKETAQRLTSVLKDGSELAFHLNIDRQAHTLAAELSLAGKDGSKLAEEIAALAGTESLFAELAGNDSALSALVHATLPESLRKSLTPLIDDGIRDALEKEQDAAKRAVAAKALKALTPTLKAGELDAAVTLRGPDADKHYTFLAAVKLREGQGLEQAALEVLKGLPDADRAKFKFEAEAAGAIKIHRVDIEKDLDAEAKRNLGSNPLYVAFRPDAVIIGGGPDGLKAVKDALGSTAKAAPPVQLQVAVARLVPLMGKKGKADPASISQTAFNSGKGSDQLQFSITGGKNLKVRLEMSAALVQFFSQLDQQEKGK